MIYEIALFTASLTFHQHFSMSLFVNYYFNDCILFQCFVNILIYLIYWILVIYGRNLLCQNVEKL